MSGFVFASPTPMRPIAHGWVGAAKALVCAWFLLATAGFASANTPANPSANPSPTGVAASVGLVNEVRFAQEGSGDAPMNLSVGAAWALASSGKGFLPIAQRGLAGSNFGLHPTPIWLAIAIRDVRAGLPVGEAGWVLEVDYPPLDRVELFMLDGVGQVLQQQLSGDKIPFSQRSMPYRSHAFSLKGDLPPDGMLMLRVQTTGVASMPVLLHSVAGFNARMQLSYVLLAMYFGLVLGLAAYNALLFVQLRDSRFGWYVGLSLALATLQGGLTGLGFQFVWPEATNWQSLAVATSIPVASVCALQFTRTFLSTAQKMPRFDKALLGLVALAFAGCVLAFVLPLSKSTLVNSLVASLTISAVFASGVNGMLRRVSGAGFFLLAWSTMLLGGVALILHNNAWVPTNAVTHYGLLIGSAMEMVLLSLALGNSVRVAHQDRAAAVDWAEQEHRLADDLRRAQARNEGLLAEREALLNNALVGMALSVKRKHTWVNDKFAQMVGFGRADMIGRTAQYLFADPNAWMSFAPDAVASLRTTGTFTRETCLRRRDGTVMWAHMAGACMRPNDIEAGVIWTILDVTAMRVSEEQTRAALVEQRQLTEARERFVAMTSHELRTPVAGILGTLELFEHYGERLSEAEKADMLRQINLSAHRLWEMTERVLLHGKAKSGQLRFSPSAVVLADWVAELTREFCSDPKHARERLVVDMQGAPATLMLDPSLLRHIAVNLLSNAFKYSPGGGLVRMSVSASPHVTDAPDAPDAPDDAEATAQTLTLVISDQGIGIPEADTPMLFRSFQRASNVGDISGTGLGLSIVKHCVDVHGGTLSVRSRVQIGSEFTVKLPATQI